MGISLQTMSSHEYRKRKQWYQSANLSFAKVVHWSNQVVIITAITQALLMLISKPHDLKVIRSLTLWKCHNSGSLRRALSLTDTKPLQLLVRAPDTSHLQEVRKGEFSSSLSSNEGCRDKHQAEDQKCKIS